MARATSAASPPRPKGMARKYSFRVPGCEKWAWVRGVRMSPGQTAFVKGLGAQTCFQAQEARPAAAVVAGSVVRVGQGRQAFNHAVDVGRRAGLGLHRRPRHQGHECHDVQWAQPARPAFHGRTTDSLRPAHGGFKGQS